MTFNNNQDFELCFGFYLSLVASSKNGNVILYSARCLHFVSTILISQLWRGLAQSIWHRIRNPMIRGSSPIGSSKRFPWLLMLEKSLARFICPSYLVRGRKQLVVCGVTKLILVNWEHRLVDLLLWYNLINANNGF